MSYNTKNHMEQGGDVLHIGGTLEFGDGSEVKNFPGGAKKAENINDASAATVDKLKEDFNQLLHELRAADLMKYNALTGIEAVPESLQLNVEGTGTITPSPIPGNATEVEYTFSSQDETIATVTDGGVVTAVAEGFTTIMLQAYSPLTRETFTVGVAVFVES